MKFALLALLGAAHADDFPAFDMFHAHCQMTTTFDQPCDSIYTILDG